MSAEPVQNKRPLSPHLQVYKPQITSVSSIFTRFAGVALVAGMFAFVGWLLALSLGWIPFLFFAQLTTNPIVFIMIFGWSWAFWYQIFSGGRHLLWDAGFGFEIEGARLWGHATFTLSFVATALTWVYLWLGAY